MNTFIKTAQSLTRKGDNFIKKNGLKQFHQFAAELLCSAGMQNTFDFEALVTSSFEKKMSDIQYYKFLEFSDLPVTLAMGHDCFIDVYFWRRRPTVIHNHHFVGAFQCLIGSNVDLEFAYTEEKKIGKFHGIGTVHEPTTRFLKKGDVAEINYLNKFIHQNHHQADLTVNLCFRIPEKKKTHISNFLYSGLRFEKSPAILARVERLIKFASIDDFNPKNLDLSLDDTLSFLIQTYGLSSQNQRLLKIQKMLDQRLKKETGLNIVQLLDDHEKKLDEIIDLYE